MNFAKRLLMVSGAVMLAGILGVILTPKVAHAVATLVQVGNTLANPVPVTGSVVTRDKDNGALMPFQTTLCIGSSNQGFNPCDGFSSSFAVPNGQRAVVEYISSSCFSTAPGFATGGLIVETTAGGVIANYSLNPGQKDALSGNIVGNQQTRIYADPGTTILLGGEITGGATPGASACNVAVSGHFVVL